MCNYDPLHYFISLFIISENYWEKFFNNNPSIYLSLNDISRSDSASSPSLNPSLDIFMIEGHDYFRLPSMVRANARTLGATVIYPSPFIRRRRNPRVPERNLVVTSLNIPQCHERGCLHDCQKEYENVVIVDRRINRGTDDILYPYWHITNPRIFSITVHRIWFGSTFMILVCGRVLFEYQTLWILNWRCWKVVVNEFWKGLENNCAILRE